MTAPREQKSNSAFSRRAWLVSGGAAAALAGAGVVLNRLRGKQAVCI
jgi:hypothetical protein